MSLGIRWITIDTLDPQSLAPFWEQLLGWPRDPSLDDDEGVGLLAPGDRGGTVGLQGVLLFRSDNLTPGKNRVHLDLVPEGGGTAELETEVERALQLGATQADVGQSGDEPWVVLADPQGNEFCILLPPQA